MSKWYGNIGFSTFKKTTSDVIKEEIIDRPYMGDFLRLRKVFRSSDQLNDDINVSNELSIVADPFANENFKSIRYAEFMGTKWRIESVEVQYPRLILTIGGVYNDSRQTDID